MAERKACSITIAIEPTLLSIAKQSTDNLSFLMRRLLIAHLITEKKLDTETLTKILV